ncbi:hypothetical protein GF337_04435 [candidate division KSB1 bacterium]|nr:hypothetical protein [candidate division KSB1 bacterium]
MIMKAQNILKVWVVALSLLLEGSILLGDNPVSFEFSKNSGENHSSNSASSDQFTPGLNYRYFHGDWKKLPDFDKLNPVAIGVINNFDIRNRLQNDHFAFQFQGFINIERRGDYEFYLKSDDGSRLLIDDNVIVDNDYTHSVREQKGSVELKAGFHAIEVQYFERKGREELEVRYDGPGIKKKKIPDEVLFMQQINGYPMPWQNQDIGRVSIEGSASYVNGYFIVKASGSDVWGDDDEFHYVYWLLEGNIEIIARVHSITKTDDWAKSGIMIRESLKDDSKHAFMMVTPDEGTAFQRRIKNGKNSYHSGSSGSVPIWLKLVRIGDTFAGYKSKDSLNWVRVGSEEIGMTAEVHGGIALTSHDDRKLCTSAVKVHFSGAYYDFELTPENDVLPANGKSTVIVRSSPLHDFTNTIVATGTPVTVSANSGEIISEDQNSEIPGIQVTTGDSGQIRFEYQAGSEPGVATISAESAFGDASGQTSVELLGENIQLVSTKSAVTTLSQGQKDIPVSLIIRNEGVMTSHIKSADLIISAVSAITDRNHFHIQRTDTLSKIAPDQTAELTFIVSAQPDADTVGYTIDGQLSTEIDLYRNCLHKHQWQVESPPALQIKSIDAFAEEIFLGQDGLIVTMEIINNGMATADSIDAALSFWHRDVDISNEYEVMANNENARLLDGHSSATLMFHVDVSTTATLDTISIRGKFSGVDVNSGIRYGSAELTGDKWHVRRAEGILFQAIDVSNKYAISGRQEPWTIRTHVQNVSGVDLELDSVRAEFHIFNENVTDEYNITYPDTFLGSGTTAFNNDEQDSLEIHVNGFGMSAGLLEITVSVYCKAREFQFIVDDSSPRGLGYIFVYGPPELQIATEIDSCYNITDEGDGIVNLNQQFAVKVVVRNIGDEDLSDVGISVLSVGKCIPESDTSRIIPSILKNRSASVFYKYRAKASLVPSVEFFNIRIDSAAGSKSGEPARVNPLSDMSARVTIFHPAELYVSADSLIESTAGKIFHVSTTVINPSGNARCDSSGEVTIELPKGYFIRGENLTKRFIPNETLSWHVRAPSKAADTDSILIYISRRPYDVNTLEHAAIGRDSAFIKVRTLEAFVNIENIAIIAPAGATDDTLSTSQTFYISAAITHQMTENIQAELIAPQGYSIQNLETAGGDTILCTWTLASPEFADIQPQSFVLQAAGNLVDDTTKIVAKPDSSIQVLTVNRASLTVEAQITEPQKAVDGHIQPDMEFSIRGCVKNNGDAAINANGSLRLDIEDDVNFQIISSDVVPLTTDSVTWRVRTSAELPQDNWVLKVGIHDIPEDVNTNSAAFVEKDYKDIPVTSASGGVGRLEFMVKKIPDIAPTSIIAGETKMLLGIACTNLSADSDIPILLKSIRFDTYGGEGDLIYPFQLMSRIRILDSQHRSLAESSDIYANPVRIEFIKPDTIRAQQTDSLYFEVDFHENLNKRFYIHIRDSSYISATSIVDVYTVNAPGNSHGLLDISSHCPVIIERDLEKSFRCYPNPFGSSSRRTTNFVYYLDRNTAVELKIFTLLGELVWETSFQKDEPQSQKGLHAQNDIQWDARNMHGREVLNGVYIAYIRTAEGKSATAKVAVLK